MVARVIRRLEGITYWVINDSEGIRRFINTSVRRKWEEDNRNDRVNSRMDDWLLSLSKRQWRLQTLSVNRVKLNPAMVARRSFRARLKARSEEMQRSIASYGVVIWPLVIK